MPLVGQYRFLIGQTTHNQAIQIIRTISPKFNSCTQTLALSMLRITSATTSMLIAHLISALCLISTSGCAIVGPHPAQEPPQPFATDGCTLSPDLNFAHCCEAHDRIYWRGGSCESRRDADYALKQCISQTRHPVLGFLYWITVRVTGSPQLPTPWRWGFGWLKRQGYTEACGGQNG